MQIANCKLRTAPRTRQSAGRRRDARVGTVSTSFPIDVLGQGFSLKSMNRISTAGAPKRRFSRNPTVFWTLTIVAVLVLTLCQARADDPEGQYLHIFDTIQQGDLMKKNGQVDNALARYREAQIALAKFQRTYPERDAKVVAYRLTYVSTQIAALAPQATSTERTN